MSVVNVVIDRVCERAAAVADMVMGRGYARVGQAGRPVSGGDERISVRGLLVGVPVSLSLWFCIARLARNLL